MEPEMRFFEPFLVNMRVNLRGGDIDMAQHLLDDSQVGAVVEKVRGETMP